MIDQQNVLQSLANFIHQNQANGVMFSALFQQASPGNYNNQTMQKLVANAMSIIPVVIRSQPHLANDPASLGALIAQLTCRVTGASIVQRQPHLATSMSPQERADFEANLVLRTQLDNDTQALAAAQQRSAVVAQPQVHGPVTGYVPHAVVPQSIQQAVSVTNGVALRPTTLNVAPVHKPVQQQVVTSAPELAPPLQQNIQEAPRVSDQVASLALPAYDAKKLKVYADPQHTTHSEEIIKVEGMKLSDHTDGGSDVIGNGAAFQDAREKSKRFWSGVIQGKVANIDALPLNPDEGKIDDNDIVIYPEVMDYMSLSQAMAAFQLNRFGYRDKHPELRNVIGHFTFRNLQMVHALDDTEINTAEQCQDEVQLGLNPTIRAYFDYGQNLADVDPIEFSGFLAKSSESTSPLERKLAQDTNVRMTKAFNNYRQHVVGDNSFSITNYMEDAEDAIDRLKAYARKTYGNSWNTVVPITSHLKQLVRRHANYIRLNAEEAARIAPTLTSPDLSVVVEKSIYRSTYVTVGVLPLSSVDLGIYFDETIVQITHGALPELHSYLGELCRRETADLEKMPHRRVFVTTDFVTFEVIAVTKSHATKEISYVVQYLGQVL